MKCMSERMSEKLAELIKEADLSLLGVAVAGEVGYLAQRLVVQGVLVPTTESSEEVNSQVYYEDDNEIRLTTKYTFSWEERRTIYKAKEDTDGND